MILENPSRELAYATPAKGTFLRGRTPKELYRRGAPDAERVTDQEVAKYHASLPDSLYYSLYWTVYKYRETENSDEKRGILNYDSLVFDKIFLELEHQECGVLCPHTMEEARHLLSWGREDGLHPIVVYSGGKSLHFYYHFEDVAPTIKEKNRHEVVKEGCKTMGKAASLALHDEVVARTGSSQIARLPGARNSATGYFSNIIVDHNPASIDAFMSMDAAAVIDAATEKNDDEVYKFLESRDSIKRRGDNKMVANVTSSLEEKVERRRHRRRHRDGDDRKRGAIRCTTVDDVMESRPPKGERYYHAMVLIDYYLREGAPPRTTKDKLLSWNQKNGVRLPRKELLEAVDYRTSQGDYNRRPCRWLLNVGKKCPQCDAGRL